MVLLLRKQYFTKDPEGVHYFPGGGPIFSWGGGGDPHMGNVIITGNIYHNPASNHNFQALICQA